MKPALHYYLPPLYRFIESVGLSLPREHFTPASYVTCLSTVFGLLTPKNREYKKVPSLPDNILFGLSEIPTLIHNIRRPRSDSVGPQSAADAYEALACRDKRRRESIGTNQSRSPSIVRDAAKYKGEMGGGYTDAKALISQCYDEDDDDGDDERAEVEVFMKIERPRVRYDVEVVTKLVVYAGRFLSTFLFGGEIFNYCVHVGIAWFAVEGIPIFFEVVGLGIWRSGV